MSLSDVRIIDLTRLLPGPYCTSILADLGADVIKVEDPGLGDYMRQFPPQLEGKGAYFETLNRNKKGLRLDLKKEKGKEVFRKLVKSADLRR